MDIIRKLKEKVKNNKMTIVLPESNDKRILDAVKIVVKEDLANIILIGDINNIKKINNDIDFSKVRVINPLDCEYINRFVDKLYELRKDKGLSREEARELLLNDYMYFSCMLLKMGYADGVVSGACHSSSNTLRPALQIIKAKENIELVSAFFLIDVPNCEYGSNGVFIFADSGLVQYPSSRELALIAGESAKSFEMLVGEKPVVAMISHSTKDSAKGDSIDKVKEAVSIANSLYPEYVIDGELQVDAAIVPEVSNVKDKDGIVKGKANVLVFPDLDSGNIGYKLVERLAKAKAYGPICQGLDKPVNDLSRGSSVEDIIGVIVITCMQAINNKKEINK